MGRITKAVIPAAGMGTRFLPATKSQPKEMLPLVDKPAIQYVVEEAARAELHDILVVTGRGKRAIEDHFDRNVELEFFLEQRNRHDLLAEIRAANEIATLHYVRQQDPLGLGHAVSMARDHVGGESFAVLLGDDVMVDDSRLLRSMLELHEREGGSVLALMEVPADQISAYGAVGVRSIVEKPSSRDAPSNLAVIGRYVLEPEIFDALDQIEPGVGGELQITDAIATLLSQRPVYGVVFTSGRYDLGRKLEFMMANLEVGLDRPDLGPELADALRVLVRRRGLV